MEQRFIITIAALTALAVSGGALAQDDAGEIESRHKARSEHRVPGGGFGGPEEMIGRMAEHLDLDEQQRQQVENVMQAAKPEFESLRERANANRQAVRALDVNDPDYGSMLQNLSAESGEIAADLTLLTGRVRADVHGILTVEQQQKLDERMAEFGDRFARRPRHRSR